MTRTLFKAALILAVRSVLVPVVLIFIIVIVAMLLGFGFQYFFLLAVVPVPLISYLVYRRFDVKTSELPLPTPKDWERLALALSLILTAIGATFALSSFYGQTVTQSSCVKPSNVNVTSPNCTIIQTVSVPESTLLGPWVTLLIDVILLVIVAFGVWTAYLYMSTKTGIK